jgi:hypothetical protein
MFIFRSALLQELTWTLHIVGRPSVLGQWS